MKNKKQKLSTAENRIAVAKDVLQRLRVGKLKAVSGSYVEENFKDTECLYGPLVTGDDVDNHRDVRDVINSKLKSCEVCAKGALLISTIMKFDNMPATDKISLEFIAETSDYKSPFSKSQLDMMENSFEGLRSGGLHDFHGSYQPGVKAFYEKYEDDKSRMRGIMKNVIAGNGKFDPKRG